MPFADEATAIQFAVSYTHLVIHVGSTVKAELELAVREQHRRDD